MNIRNVICMLYSRNKIFLHISIIAMLFLSDATTAQAFAETRNIYVGDIISLEIEASNLYEDELRKKFQDFEIIDLQRTSDGYSVSLRTFDVGERKIVIGDKELVINVASTLNDIERDGVFEGETAVLQAGFYFRWRIVFYCAAGIFALSAIAVFSKAFIKRKSKKQTPYETFIKSTNGLIAENDNYLVDLTFYFKEYIEKTKICRIIGKTSIEIVAELKELGVLDTVLPDIKEWLIECDRLKFAKTDTSAEEKRHHYTQLLSLADKIEKNEGMA